MNMDEKIILPHLQKRQDSHKKVKKKEEVDIIGDTFSYPKNSESVTEGPAAQEVNIVTVIENHDSILLSIQRRSLWVCVKCTFCPRPPIQGSHHL